MNRKRSRRAGAIEIAAWVLGCSLLTSYGAARLLSTAAHDQGLDEFHRARAAAHALGRSIEDAQGHRVERMRVERTTAGPSVERTDAVDFDTGVILDALDIPAPVLGFELPPAPNMRDWSPSRITAYLSTLTSRDAPEAVLRIASVDLDVDVLAATDEASVTLVTCFPFYYVGPAPMRYVVFASAAAGPDQTLPVLSENVPGAN